MEFSWELVEKGRAGVVTLIGMGGVFTALIFLYIFTSVLGRIGRRRKRAGTAGAAGHESLPAGGDGAPPGPQDGEALAAAVAVSLALGERAHTPGRVIAPLPAESGVNPWKLAGRRALMHSSPPGRRGRH